MCYPRNKEEHSDRLVSYSSLERLLQSHRRHCKDYQFAFWGALLDGYYRFLGGNLMTCTKHLQERESIDIEVDTSIARKLN